MIFQRLPVALSALLVVALSGTVYWQLKPLLEPKKQVTVSAKTVNLNAPTNKRDHNISAFKLFGNASSPKVVNPVQQKLPVTKLRLTLTGVLASLSATEASALIEGPDKKTENYRIGEELPGNAILKHVYADRVIVERAGRLENLYFPEVISSGISAANDNLPDYSTTPPPVPIRAPQTSPDSTMDARKQSIKDRLSKLRKRIINKQN